MITSASSAPQNIQSNAKDIQSNAKDNNSTTANSAAKKEDIITRIARDILDDLNDKLKKANPGLEAASILEGLHKEVEGIISEAPEKWLGESTKEQNANNRFSPIYEYAYCCMQEALASEEFWKKLEVIIAEPGRKSGRFYPNEPDEAVEEQYWRYNTTFLTLWKRLVARGRISKGSGLHCNYKKVGLQMPHCSDGTRLSLWRLLSEQAHFDKKDKCYKLVLDVVGGSNVIQSLPDYEKLFLAAEAFKNAVKKLRPQIEKAKKIAEEKAKQAIAAHKASPAAAQAVKK